MDKSRSRMGPGTESGADPDQLMDRQSFLLSLADAVRDLAAPRCIMHHAASALGRRLGCGRVRYVDLDRAQVTFAASAEWSNVEIGVEPVEDRFSLSQLDPKMVNSLKQGNVVRIDNVLEDVRSRSQADLYLQFGVAAGLAVPLVKEGALVAALSIHHPAPRAWTDDEVELVREVAERTWSAVQQARAEAELKQARAELELALEVAGLGHWQLDLETDQLIASDEFKALFGCSVEEELKLQAIAGYIQGDDRPRFQSSLAEAIARKSSFDLECRCLVGGAVRWIVLKGRYEALDRHAGRLFGVGQDVTERRMQAEAQRLDAERLRLIIDSAQDYAILTADDDGIITSWNAGAKRILGFSEQEALGQHLRIFFSEEDVAAGLPALEMETARRAGRANDERWHRRKDGSLFWASGEMFLLDSGTGGFLKIFRDLTDRRNAEERTRILIDELNHRVKNTLGVVQSITNQTLKGTDLHPDARRALDGRLQALAASHDLLTRSHWEGADLADVVRLALKPFLFDAGSNVEVSDVRVALQPKAAVSLGLAVHELAANAARHGALRDPDGIVAIHWSLDGSFLRFSWRERGGRAKQGNSSPGFGTRFLQHALPYELGGSTQVGFTPTGAEISLKIPREGNVK